MEVIQLKKRTGRDYANTICLIGVIPFLVFLYLLINKIGTFEKFTTDVWGIILTATTVFLMGVVTGRESLQNLINSLFDYNHKIIVLQDELIKKNKLAAVTETVLTLSHEISNPLFIIQGNLELLKDDFEKSGLSPAAKERIEQVKNNCKRIVDVTNDMLNLSRPVSETIHGDIKIISLKSSEQKKEERKL
ncbi:MAG: histidine kinase dimerization/phospho-acceptor domain-containing protein [Candidatus Omnitrophica bacterium]|nr:histidine kinase dimerization/phospho-acceptor domain-containing protein [Candidatus Omnitrophota bacterium]